MSTNDDLYKFKEEIILRITEIEKNILKIQPKSNESQLTEIITKYEKFTERLNEIEKMANKDKVIIDSVHSLKTWESIAQDQLSTSEIRLNAIQKELKDTTSKYDKLYLSNLFIPGVIGEHNCRFKNMREFVEVCQILKIVRY